MGKTRGTQNQDYFKLSGSAPERDLAESAKQAFGMQRTRERISEVLKKSVPPWMSGRVPPVERSEVIERPHGQGDARSELLHTQTLVSESAKGHSPGTNGRRARARHEVHMTEAGTPPAGDMPTPSVLGFLREVLMLPLHAARHPLALASWIGRMARDRFNRYADIGRSRLEQA